MITDSLLSLWVRSKPVTKLGRDLDKQELFKHYLYLDYLSETRHDDMLNGFWYYFHIYQLSNFGLEHGVMEYRRAREFLYETLSYNKPDRIMDIFLFWLDTLEKMRPTSLEAWSDRKVVVEKILSTLGQVREPELRAEYAGYLIERAGAEFSTHDAEMILARGAKAILQIMPNPVNFSYAYRPRRNYSLIRSRCRKKEPHGNSMRWIVSFIYSARRMGKLESVKQLTDYLCKVLEMYDPARGDTYTTGLLLDFASIAEVVPASLQENFDSRVERSLEAIGDGIHGRDNLLGNLVLARARSNELDRAYFFLRKISEETHFLHASGSIMRYETSLDRIEAEYTGTYLPLVAKTWGRKIDKLTTSELKEDDYHRHIWMLEWLLSGEHRANRGDFSILNRPDVLRYVGRGRADFHLTSLAEMCQQHPSELRWLLLLIRQRIAEIFLKANSGQSGFLSGSDYAKSAIECELILRKSD